MTHGPGRPRVFFVNRVYRPSEAATAQLLADLAESLAERGWDVHVVATGPVEPERPLSGNVSGVTIHRAGPTLPHRGWFSQAGNYRRFHAAMTDVLRSQLQPGDVVVAMTDPPMLAAAVAQVAHACRARVVHWIQDIHPEVVSAHFGAAASLPLLPLRWRRNRAWRQAAACVPVSAAMAGHVQAQRIPSDRIFTVLNWAPRELDQVASPTDLATWRTAHGLDKRFVVAYSGNLGRVHEFDTLLAAASALRDDPQIRFLIMGNGPRLAEVQAAARHHHLANILFLPPQPRSTLAISLAAPDAHVVTLRPSFGHLVSPSKLAGVLAAARPVVFVGPSETASYVTSENCGAILSPGRPAELAALLQRWSDDPKLCAQMSTAARAAYVRHFTLSGAVSHWERILHFAQGDH